jgi:hypothetical protein
MDLPTETGRGKKAMCGFAHASKSSFKEDLQVREPRGFKGLRVAEPRGSKG